MQVRIVVTQGSPAVLVSGEDLIRVQYSLLCQAQLDTCCNILSEKKQSDLI